MFWVISIYAADCLGFCGMKDYSEVCLLYIRRQDLIFRLVSVVLGFSP